MIEKTSSSSTPTYLQKYTRQAGFAVLALGLAALVAGLYSPGWSGSWHYDDAPSLSGLDNVTSPLEKLEYALDGIAGPLGRPVALLSFAMQTASWPDDPRAFLLVNTLIHGFNTLLVFAVSLLLGRFLAPKSDRVYWLALAVAALWSLSPFLSSASLMVVQRMTTLSATFLFAGLAVYLYGRWSMAVRPKRGLVLALCGLGGGTLLAAFTKENGALLPLFALICELLVISRSRTATPPVGRLWYLLALVLPVVLIASYLIYRGVAAAGYDFRHFNVLERLITQSRIMWDYVFNLLVPRTTSVTPYTDTFPVSRGALNPPATLAAIIGLLTLAGLAAASIRQFPVFAFGVAWFLGGHALESSTIALELYYAHRNYVPAFGLYFALLYYPVLSSRAKQYSKLVTAGILSYILVFAVVLASTTSLWGQPALAAEMWYLRDEGSVRAAQGLAKVYLEENDPVAAAQLLETALEKNPENQLLAVQALQFCHYGREDYEAKLTRALTALSPPRTVGYAAAGQLYALAQATDRTGCEFLGQEELERLCHAALQKSHRHRNLKTTHQLHYVGAHLARLRGDRPGVRWHFHEALNAWRDPETAILIAYSFVLDGDIESARQYLRTELESPPTGLIEKNAWQRRLGAYLEILEQ